MKKIFKLLEAIQSKNYYYRLIITPQHIDVKLYSNDKLDSKECNYAVMNTEDDRYALQFSLELFLQKL